MTSKKRILVATYHSLVDLSNGAALSLRFMMEGLAVAGWEVRTLCGPCLDFESSKSVQDLLDTQGIRYRKYKSQYGQEDFTLYVYKQLGIESAVWVPSNNALQPNAVVGSAWLSTYRELLATWIPDVVITYGGHWMTVAMLQMANEFNAKTVFYLCNYEYSDRSLFSNVDLTIVLSKFQQEWYNRNIGLESISIYPLIPRSRYECFQKADAGYVTFVNPQPHKGVYVFAKIAEVLNKSRPDIQFLVVEGRATARWIWRTGAKLSPASVFQMANTSNPRNYLQVTKIMLMPSVWQESFGRVAAEAMLNGIPTIGSSRGSLPEVIGDNGILIDLPPWCTVDSNRLPSEEEISEWVMAIEALWDNEDFYLLQSSKAVAGAARWEESKVTQRFEQALLSLIGKS